MHGARDIERVVRPAAPALEDDRLTFAHRPFVVGEHQVGEILPAVLGAELQRLLRGHHGGALLLHILPEASGDLAPRPTRPDHRHDLAQPGLVHLGAAAQELDLLRRLHLTDVEPAIEAIDHPQPIEHPVHMLPEAQIVEADPRALEPEIAQGGRRTGDQVRLEVTDHFFTVETLDIGLQRIEPDRFGLPRHKRGVQELGDPHPGDPGRGLEQAGHRELRQHEGRGFGRIPWQDHRSLVLGKPPFGDAGPEPGGVVDIAWQRGDQGIEASGLHLLSGSFQVQQHATPLCFD